MVKYIIINLKKGCRDYSSILTIPSILNFWENFPNGINYCRKYNINLLLKIKEIIIEEWKIDKNDIFYENISMMLIPLPSNLIINDIKFENIDVNGTDQQAFYLQEILHYEYKIEVPIKCLEKRIYIRISCHIYNNINDYLKIINIIKKFLLK
jgi:isopenicillin-N epimerase